MDFDIFIHRVIAGSCQSLNLRENACFGKENSLKKICFSRESAALIISSLIHYAKKISVAKLPFWDTINTS